MTVQVQWVGYPRSYTKGRPRPVQVVVLHYTAGSEGPTSAEAGARYDKTRTDGTSTGFFTDSAGPALQEVPDGDRAHAARQHGNDIGIQIEICGTAQTRAQWLDSVSMATLRTTAGVVAMLLERHHLAFRRLTVDELRRAYYNDRSITGIVEHATCTLAFPEDQGTHMDVGPGFPWDVFMDMVRREMDGSDEVYFFQTSDLKIGRGNDCTFEYAETQAEWDAWRGDPAYAGVEIRWGGDARCKQADFDSGRRGIDITGYKPGGGTGGGGVTIKQVRDEIAATTLTPQGG